MSDITRKYWQRFQRDHVLLNKTVKISSAGIEFARQCELSTLSHQIASVHPQKWKQGLSLEPGYDWARMVHLTSGMQIVHAEALCEIYLDSVEGVIGNRSTKIQMEKSGSTRNEEPEIKSRIKVLFQKAQWTWPCSMEHLIVVREFYRIGRNCVAHRGGRASSLFHSECETDQLEDAWHRVEKTHVRCGGSLPGIPKAHEDTVIPFDATHVIMFSAVNYWLLKLVQDCFQQSAQGLG